MKDFKRVILPLLALIIFITVVGFYYRQANGQPLFPGKSSQTPAPLKSVVVTVNGISVPAEEAVSASERKTGLSNRTSLPSDSGMLFVLGNVKSIPSFWMKDMRFPIDILWIKDGKILKIDKNVPVPPDGADDKDLSLYHPSSPVQYVLEVNAGFSDLNGFKVGDSVQIQ